MGESTSWAGGTTQDQVALQVLTTAREQLNAERVRAINALTALVRSHALGIDARRALSATQIKEIARWRRRGEAMGIATARLEAVRLAARVVQLNIELKDNRDEVTAIVEARAPELLAMPGVGAITAAVILCVWSHHGRVRSEAAMAQIAGTCPIPASSGNTERHRLNRGGDRRLNWALNTIVLTRMRDDNETRLYVERRTTEGKTRREIRRCLKRYTTRQIYRTLNAAHSPEALTPAA